MRHLQTPTETQEAIALVKWLNHNRLVFVHIPNEGYRDRRGNAIAIAKGMQVGFLDYLILSRTDEAPHGCWIELKRRNGKADSIHQIIWGEKLSQLGIVGKFCFGAKDAVDFLIGLGYVNT